MPEVRLLVPLADNSGKEHPAGEVIDVDVETAEAWRAQGKVSLISTEQALAEAANAGNYSDVVGREEIGQVDPTQLPGPQEAVEDEDEPKPRKGRK